MSVRFHPYSFSTAAIGGGPTNASTHQPCAARGTRCLGESKGKCWCMWVTLLLILDETVLFLAVTPLDMFLSNYLTNYFKPVTACLSATKSVTEQ